MSQIRDADPVELPPELESEFEKLADDLVRAMVAAWHAHAVQHGCAVETCSRLAELRAVRHTFPMEEAPSVSRRRRRPPP